MNQEEINRSRREARLLRRLQEPKTCPTCAKVFVQLKSTQQIFCSIRCLRKFPRPAPHPDKIEARRLRRNLRLNKKAEEKRLEILRVCLGCGASFRSRLTRVIFCSDSCRASKIERDAKLKEEADRIASEKIPTSKYAIKKMKRKALGVIGVLCSICKTRFFPSHGTIKYCSNTCRAVSNYENAKKGRSTEESKKRRNAFLRNKMANNPEFRLRATVSKSVWRALKRIGKTKNDSVVKHLPYSIPQLKAHIESFFNNENGFTWENHGAVWHIDHVIPQSYFRYESLDSKAFRDCWSLANLMPVTREFNHSKKNYRVGTIGPGGQLQFLAV